jgi:hypothetical protein
VPGRTVDACFAARPPRQREAYDAVVAHLETLGPVHEDAVGVGVFLKHERKLAELRPAERGLSLGLFLPRTIESPRVRRTIRTSADRVVHMMTLTCTGDVDEQLRAWLTEAYLAAGG